jgi:dipeptidase E
MKGNIYLSGGGSIKETYELDDLFLKNTGEKILYIPVGLKRTFAGYDGCVDWFMLMIKTHDIEKKVTVWVDLKGKNSLIDIKNFDAVYIGGASDTFRLHLILNKDLIYESLRKYINNGGIIYGGSGGATILGKTINYDQVDKNLPIVNDFSAKLLGDYSIYTHFNYSNLYSLKKIMFGDLMIIPEKNGLIVNTKTKEVTHIGNNSSYIISKDFTKELRNNESVKI